MRAFETSQEELGLGLGLGLGLRLRLRLRLGLGSLHNTTSLPSSLLHHRHSLMNRAGDGQSGAVSERNPVMHSEGFYPPRLARENMQ